MFVQSLLQERNGITYYELLCEQFKINKRLNLSICLQIQQTHNYSARKIL